MLPLMTDQFEEFVASAKQNTSNWLLLGGVCLFLVFYAELFLLIASLFAFWHANWHFADFQIGWNSVSTLISNPDTPSAMVTVLTTFFGMFAAIFLTASLMHGRGLSTLIGHGPVFRNFFVAAISLAAILGLSTIFAHSFTEMVPNLQLTDWVLWLPLGLPLLLLQITSEELVFRGYLLQELAARFKSRWIWLALPSLVFGLLHFEPTKFGINAWLVVVATGLFGLFAADVTIRTGNLGAALGLHFINNFFAMFVTSLSGTLTGLSLYVTPFAADQTDIVRQMLILDIVAIATVYLVYLIAIRLKQGRKLHSMSVDPM